MRHDYALLFRCDGADREAVTSIVYTYAKAFGVIRAVNIDVTKPGVIWIDFIRILRIARVK